MACSLRTGFSVCGSNDALLVPRVKGSLGYCPPGALQFADSRSKEFMGKPLNVSVQNLSIRDAKTPRSFSLKAQGSNCVSKALRWWEKTSTPNMIEIHSATELVDSLLNAGDRLVIIDFYSPGCGGCKALHPKICQLAESNPDAVILKVNYEEMKTMCQSLHIHVLPFFRFYRGAQGRVCSFSCTNATIKKFKDAVAKYGSDRQSLGSPRGLEESELLALGSIGEISRTVPLDSNKILEEFGLNGSTLARDESKMGLSEGRAVVMA